jgi:hypothetical protein
MSNKIKEPPLWWRIYICFKSYKAYQAYRHRRSLAKAFIMLGKVQRYVNDYDDYNKLEDIRWNLFFLENELWNEEFKKYEH